MPHRLAVGAAAAPAGHHPALRGRVGPGAARRHGGHGSARGLALADLPGFEPGGPRRKIFFDPSKTRVGIVTCGGLCPGLNDVIRALVPELTSHYGVHRIVGFRNGYQGLIARYGRPVVDLTPDTVSGINEYGGTVLGTSRGNQDPDEIVDL